MIPTDLQDFRALIVGWATDTEPLPDNVAVIIRSMALRLAMDYESAEKRLAAAVAVAREMV